MMWIKMDTGALVNLGRITTICVKYIRVLPYVEIDRKEEEKTYVD